MNLRNFIRLKMLKASHSNLIITQHWELKDQHGKIVYKNSKVSDSLVGNFLQLLYCGFSNFSTTNWTASNYNGVTADNHHALSILNTSISYIGGDAAYMAAVAGNLQSGMVYGTGTTAPAPTDYKVETLINEGVGANQLSYDNMRGGVAPSSVGSTTTFRIQRSATNNTGSDVNVSEVGLYLKNGFGTICIYRDLFTPAVPVPNLQTLTTIIEFSIDT